MGKTKASSNHYKTLEVNPSATQQQIKQSYRRLVKLFHPDSNKQIGDREQIIRINAAYEVLSDPQRRQSYDRDFDRGSRHQTQTTYKHQYHQTQKRGNTADGDMQKWLNQVYKPIDRMLQKIIYSLKNEIDKLSADPFDDLLLEAFQAYLEKSQNLLKQAQNLFRSQPNPSNVAGVAAHLYYCLNQTGDGIEQLEFFTFNYDDYYLHTGQELFRIADGLRQEARTAIKTIL